MRVERVTGRQNPGLYQRSKAAIQGWLQEGLTDEEIVEIFRRPLDPRDPDDSGPGVQQRLAVREVRELLRIIRRAD